MVPDYQNLIGRLSLLISSQNCYFVLDTNCFNLFWEASPQLMDPLLHFPIIVAYPNFDRSICCDKRCSWKNFHSQYSRAESNFLHGLITLFSSLLYIMYHINPWDPQIYTNDVVLLIKKNYVPHQQAASRYLISSLTCPKDHPHGFMSAIFVIDEGAKRETNR